MRAFLALALAALSASAAFAKPPMSEPSVDGRTARSVETTARQIDYPRFAALTGEVEAYRQSRLVDLAQFRRMARSRDTLVLDARSERAFARGHIEGAVNLPFSDFTAERLRGVIGDSNRRVLIYCNNNFRNDAPPVVLKSAPLALNIPTFINLYGYGYRNIYELGEVVDFTDPRVNWVQSD